MRQYFPNAPPRPYDLLADVLAFLARDDLCPIVQAAIGYAARHGP